MKTDSSFSPLALRPAPAARMPIIIKARREIELMRRAGKVGHDILLMMKEIVRPGLTTAALNELAADELAKNGAIGMSKNYPTYKEGEGYPAETCISVNEEVVHGIPSSRMLREGDVVTLDLALKVGGYCADTAVTVPVGRVDPRVQKLLQDKAVTVDIFALRRSGGLHPLRGYPVRPPPVLPAPHEPRPQRSGVSLPRVRRRAHSRSALPPRALPAGSECRSC